MTKVSKKVVKDTAEAKRWLIVGAYQAGATEKHVSRIAGLSKTAVRNIILNYKRTGKPCIPKKMPNKVRQKLIVEYDENGDLIDSDDDNDDDTAEEEQAQMNSIAELQNPQMRINKNNFISKKKKKSTQYAFRNCSTTKDMISYAMKQMRISELNQHNPSSTVHQSTMASPISLASSSTVKIPPPSKTDQDVRGYELWSHEDDMILLNHVLYHLHGGGWADLEIKFEGRHSARLCYDRWKHLKSLLISGITDKPNTPW